MKMTRQPRRDHLVQGRLGGDLDALGASAPPRALDHVVILGLADLAIDSKLFSFGREGQTSEN